MKHSFRTVDLDRVTEFWNGFYPEKYRIDSEILRLNTVDCPSFDWGASAVEIADGEVLGFVIVKKSPSGLYAGVDQDTAHLSAIAFREAEFGVDLMADLKRLLRNRGAHRLVLGQDSGHFFPGCPVDCPVLIGFFTVEGFVDSGEAVDLERDLQEYSNPFPVPAGDVHRRLTNQDVSGLAEFFDREFPRRWKYDVMRKVEIEGPECVFGLFRDGRVEGFALLQDSASRLPIGGAVWRNDLGENWGSLGPIGISESLRGKGSGNALLGQALLDLKSRGVRRCIIDWTTLVDFYGGHGFEVTRRYRPMSLALGS